MTKRIIMQRTNNTNKAQTHSDKASNIYKHCYILDISREFCKHVGLHDYVA